MSRIWFDRVGSSRQKARSQRFGRSNHRLLRLECLETRELLSAAPLGVATPDHTAVVAANGVTPQNTAAPTGMTPTAIRHAYGLDSVTFAGGVAANGAGTTIAIVDAYDDPNIANDLKQFDLQFKLPDPVFTKINQTGGSTMPVANSDWATEIALDAEWSHAIAPAANILLVEANSNTFADLLTAVNTARDTPGVVAVSMSWGGSEFLGETSYDGDFTTPAGHVGVSFFASSGDGGAPPIYPAASPNVVSVGGTTLNLIAGNYSSESAWSGSGGGLSVYETKPAYQQGVVTQSAGARATPDVSYDANPYTGFPVYDSYNNGRATPWGQWGGTSDAAPQWAALVAIADQGRAAAGLGSLDGAGQLLPALYQSPGGDYHDIVTGITAGTPSYAAVPGFDLATGRGTPMAAALVPALSKWSGSNSALTPPAAPGNFVVQAISSTAVTLSWSASAGVSDYTVCIKKAGLAALAGTFSGTTTSATINNLVPESTYSFDVVANNPLASTASTWLTVTMPNSAGLLVPQNFAVTATSSSVAHLSWSAVKGATGYAVYWWNGSQAVRIDQLSASTTSVDIPNLTPNSTEKFYVSAVNSIGFAATGWVSVVMPPVPILAPPQNVYTVGISSTSAQLHWNASTGATGYRVYWWNGSTSVLVANVGWQTTSAPIAGLSRTAYSYFVVVAYNATSTAASVWVAAHGAA